MIPLIAYSKLESDLSDLVKYLDYLKELPGFEDFDRDLILRLSLIRTLSSQVADRLRH